MTDGIERRAPRVRRSWEDRALLASLVFAVVAVLLLHHQILFSPITAAVAADPQRPDYLMTITAKRLPPECRSGAHQVVPAACASVAIDDATVEMRETALKRTTS